MDKLIRYYGLIFVCSSLFFLNFTSALAASDPGEGYTMSAESQNTYQIQLSKNLLKKVLKHSGYALDPSGKQNTVIKGSQITLNNRKLGKTSATGEIKLIGKDTIVFVANEKLRFAPDSAGTSITFGKLGDQNNGNSAFIVYTGRWTNFFGIRICNGQVFNIPGESQCI